MDKNKLEKSKNIILTVFNKISDDNLTGYAAQSCFFLLLSFVPFILILMSLIKYLPITPDAIIEIVSGVFPAKLSPIITSIINDIYYNSNVAIISVTTIIALWSAGKGFTAILLGFNKIYGTKKKQGWIISRIFSTLYTIVLLLIIVCTLLMFVFGKHLIIVLYMFVPKIAALFESVFNNKSLLFPGILMIIFLAMYTFIPKRKTKLLNELPGAITASIGWLLFSFVYSLYTNHSSNFSSMYGTVSTLIFALIWLYFCMIILFLGAELNVFLTEYRKLKDSSSSIEEIEN